MKDLLNRLELDTLAAAIAAAERTTSGEIRVVLRHRRRWSERRLSIQELALREFRSLRMDRTRQRTGILLFLLASERTFHIVADEGIHGRVAEGTWDAIADRIIIRFREGAFLEGLREGVAAVGEVLSRHFPRAADDTDELPNEIVQD